MWAYARLTFVNAYGNLFEGLGIYDFGAFIIVGSASAGINFLNDFHPADSSEDAARNKWICVG